MELYMWIGMGILMIIIAALIIKIHLLKTSAREIKEGFRECMDRDTNMLISISGRDPDMRNLAESLNIELRHFQELRHRFLQGDMELKEAVTNVSHDLRTPITAVSGYLELLKKEEKSPAVKRYLGIIEERMEAMKQLTQELFSYTIISSKESETREMGYEEISLNSVLEESIAAYYAALKGCGITPEIYLPEEPVLRRLNRKSLSRILGNIISNAIKYSDGDLKIELTRAGEIFFSNSASRLDETMTGRLFDRYYTVENAAPSTGLGLSIARRLTEQMGGRISACYREGRLIISIEFQ